MTDTSFETALSGRIDEMLDACTRCGKCVAACPSVRPAGIADANPVETMSGIIDILRAGEDTPDSERTAAARIWAKVCTYSGDCIKACAYGVNPRFLLAMTRMAMAKEAKDLPGRRRKGVEDFRNLARDVHVLPRLQLTAAQLARLGQGEQGAAIPDSDELPDFVFYTGCNVLKTPHIALLALDIMDALGITYRVLGGPSHCCGTVHMRAGDTEVLGRIANRSFDKLARSKSGQVISWCPSCQVQFTEMTLPAIEKQHGHRPFEMTPFMKFLAARLDRIRPLLRHPVPARVALHKHPGVAGAMEAAEELLRAVPGVELVDLKQPAVGLQSVYMATLPDYRRELQLQELEAAKAAKVDVLAAVYHSDHRELCAHERDWPFRIVNALDIIGASMGLHEDDAYKRLKLLQDTDAILADCGDLIARNHLDADEARRIVTGMLRDQPLPLTGSGPR